MENSENNTTYTMEDFRDEAKLAEFVKSAKTNPQGIKDFFKDNSFRGFRDKYGYMAKGDYSFSDQLAFIDAVFELDPTHCDFSFTVKDAPKKLSQDDLWHLESIKSKIYETNPSSSYNRHIDWMAHNSVYWMRYQPALLACENLPKDICKEVLETSQTYGSWYGKGYNEAVIKNISPRHIDKEFLQVVGQNFAYTHKLDNSPEETKFIKALLKEGEKYKYTSDGHEKTKNQQFNDLIDDLYGKYASEFKKGTIYNYYNETTALQDIKAGRVADLSAEGLENLLSNDKNKFWMRQIPKEVLESKKLMNSNRTRGQNAIYSIQNPNKYNMKYFGSTLDSKNLSLAEKENYMEALIKIAEDENKEKTPEAELLRRRVEEENKKAQELSQNAASKRETKDNIEELQKAYANLKQYLQDGNASEQGLSIEGIEKLLKEKIEGKETKVEVPNWGSLPLLFGRKEEQARRDSVTKAVTNFNTVLGGIKNPECLSGYSGVVLSESSKTIAEREHKEIFHNACAQNRRANDLTEQLTSRESTINDNNQDIAMVREKLDKYKKVLKGVSQEELGLGQTEQLEDANLAKDREEKTAIRKANKGKDVDKLAEKSEKMKNMTNEEKVQYRRTILNKAKSQSL